MNEEKDSASISVETARQMVAAFTQYNEETPSDAYTKAVWFPIEQIERLYTTLKEQNADGLRLYFAKYTKETAAGLPDYYVGRNTIIFVPTQPSKGYGDSIHEDDLTVNPENKGTLCPIDCEGTTL